MEVKGHHNEAGKSSFGMVDRNKLFDSLHLKTGMTFLDVGSGRGEYSLEACHQVGNSGKVIALDKWEVGVNDLIENALAQGLTNLSAFVNDASTGIPVAEGVVDTCLMSMVIHGFVRNGIFEKVIKEVSRVMKSNAQLAIIEWKKIQGPPGPAIDLRLSDKDIEQLVNPMGFIKEDVVALGNFLYLVTFRREF